MIRVYRLWYFKEDHKHRLLCGWLLTVEGELVALTKVERSGEAANTWRTFPVEGWFEDALEAIAEGERSMHEHWAERIKTAKNPGSVTKAYHRFQAECQKNINTIRKEFVDAK